RNGTARDGEEGLDRSGADGATGIAHHVEKPGGRVCLAPRNPTKAIAEIGVMTIAWPGARITVAVTANPARPITRFFDGSIVITRPRCPGTGSENPRSPAR